MSTKSGPNGHAMANMMKDFFALPYEARAHLENLGGESFKKEFSSFIDEAASR
jgi:hypothetical protein